MTMDLTGINNCNEYYSNHYFLSVFEENAKDTISAWRAEAKEGTDRKPPWARMREAGHQFYTIYEQVKRLKTANQIDPLLKEMVDLYLSALGYPDTYSRREDLDENIQIPIYREIKKANDAPLLWVLLADPFRAGDDEDLLDGHCFIPITEEEGSGPRSTKIPNEELINKIFFSISEPPRWILLIGLEQIELFDRNKWGEKRYLDFDLVEIFRRREETTLQAMAVLLHKDSICPNSGQVLLDILDENSHQHASGVSEKLKYTLRESIELLGNEVLYDLAHRQKRNLSEDPVDASALTVECLRYMYRMLFMLFIEARPELGYTPMKNQLYFQGYSLESLREIADSVRDDTSEIGDGYYLHETLAKLYDLIYNGYPTDEEELKALRSNKSLNDIFYLEPLKSHIFDPEYTPLITAAKLRNSVMLKIIDRMSISRPSGRNERAGRISYSMLGINQMGAVYEALLSYRGFIAEETLFEVKRAQDKYDELQVGYFVPERDLNQYSEDERVRNDDGTLKKHEKGKFIYRLAGREREKSASYYTPECLTKCLVKYALKELLEGKSADEILELTVCEPAMGSAAFLNEAINQLAEAYLERKQAETGKIISAEQRFQELQKVKMFIADRNVYGVDLNPVAVELAEVSLWLNTIFSGGYIPWFGTQLVNGNSLIGARKQCYRVEQLQTNQAPEAWYLNAPVRVLPGTKRLVTKQVYHFLAGDPGMASYTDRVIKGLAPEKIALTKKWNEMFTKKFSESEVETVLHLSEIIDRLWLEQVILRKEVDENTNDELSIFGHVDTSHPPHTTIRQKDEIYKKLYLSEKMQNAGPYARLKFAMDYWCALWFWPIEKADLLPKRSEFLFDMAQILEGTISAVSVANGKIGDSLQTTLFPNEIQQMAEDLQRRNKELGGTVDLNALCNEYPRLKLAREIATENHFMHWELEFADLFEKRGGFDLVIGNPPWIKITWNEQATLSDINAIFSIKNLTAPQTAQARTQELQTITTKNWYISEYEKTSGFKNYLNCIQNYSELQGLSTNLDQCFLPQAWRYGSQSGISAFLHPDNIYTSTNGGDFRRELYKRLIYHFQFCNELNLFADVHHSTEFSINVYSNQKRSIFESISNIYAVSTIDECYEAADSVITRELFGKRDSKGKWNIHGHPSRIITVSKKEKQLFAKIFDGSMEWEKSSLPAIHSKELVDVLNCFATKQTIGDYPDIIYTNGMWHETNAQTSGIITFSVRVPETNLDSIYSSAHIGICNPLNQTTRRNYRVNSDYDKVDLTNIPSDFHIRIKYSPACSASEYLIMSPTTRWDTKYIDHTRLFIREMIGTDGERSLYATIFPPRFGHVNTIIGVASQNQKFLESLLACCASLPFDFLIRVLGKGHVYTSSIDLFPLFGNNHHIELAIHRALMLNYLTSDYTDQWKSAWNRSFNEDIWAKKEIRLRPEKFHTLSSKWTWETPLRTDYERRQALVEIDVLIAMTLGMTLNQLKTIYRIQFPVLQSYEADTWYDQNGRIIFTPNRSLTNVGLSRHEWEQVKSIGSGTVTQKVQDDTLPGGQVERTIEYVAPFDRCDREKDYETAWAFFEERYKNS
jgi:hypothetical protein